MKRKPTLAQLKKRPALWHSTKWNSTRISYPSGRIIIFSNHGDFWRKSCLSHKDLSEENKIEFIGWL